MFYFLISKGDGSFCFLFCYRPIEIPPQQPRHRLLSHHRQPIVLADGQAKRLMAWRFSSGGSLINLRSCRDW